jgi:hypothetical protein
MTKAVTAVAATLRGLTSHTVSGDSAILKPDDARGARSELVQVFVSGADSGVEDRNADAGTVNR